MKRKFLFLLLNLCFITSLVGCKQDEIETIPDTTITISVSDNELEYVDDTEDTETNTSDEIAENTEFEEKKEYLKVNNYYDLLTYPVLNITDEYLNTSQLIYFEDPNLAKLLYALNDNYYFVFDYEEETDENIYETVSTEGTELGIEIFTSLNPETDNNTLDNTAEDETNVDEEDVENETDINSDLDTNLNSDTEDEIVSDDEEQIENTNEITTNLKFEKYPFTLNRFKSVSVYSLDKELLIKNATSENDFSFISNN